MYHLKLKIAPSSSAAIAVSMSLLLSACYEKTTFVVILETPGASTKAELEICGRRIQMTPQDAGFTAVTRDTCEGGAIARITLADGSTIACEDVYVTPDLGVGYEFAVADRQCSVRLLDLAERAD